MIRYAAHFVYCSPQQIISQGVVEVDSDGRICRLFSLADFPEETHTTVFYNGVIFPRFPEADEILKAENQEIFSLLNTFFADKRGLKVGEKANLCLIEDLDLSGKQILPHSRLIILC
ncbi:MAG: hypothetical protein LBR81_05190 [Prevotellaceae bacterium]|jgi:hypothetical protein|nr:hypothetical protein [Prevotellaceae bacterium]